MGPTLPSFQVCCLCLIYAVALAANMGMGPVMSAGETVFLNTDVLTFVLSAEFLLR